MEGKRFLVATISGSFTKSSNEAADGILQQYVRRFASERVDITVCIGAEKTGPNFHALKS
jgi:hypothetical protein